jgi:glutathione transport system permease protein
VTAQTAPVPAPAAAIAPRPSAALRRLLRDRLALAAAIVLVILVAAAILAPWIAPNDPYLTNTRLRMLPPVWEGRGRWQFLLGTDGLGRCLFSRVLFGLRATLMMGLIATAIGGAIGLALGLFAAFYKRLDGWLMHLNDILLSFPAILLGLAFAAVVGPGMTAVVVSLAIATIPTVARVTRASALVVMGQDFIEAGRAIGLDDRTLLTRYLALNCISLGLRLPDAALRPGHPARLGPVLPRPRRPAARRRARHHGLRRPQRALPRTPHRHHPLLRHRPPRPLRQRPRRRPPRPPRPAIEEYVTSQHLTVRTERAAQNP